MKTVTALEAKAHLSRLLAFVQSGESVLILSCGEPVARLEAVRESFAAPPAIRVERLVRRGVLRRPARDFELGRGADGKRATSEGGLLAALLLDRGRER